MVMPANTYGTVMAAIISVHPAMETSVGSSLVIKQNWTSTDAGMATAVSSEVSESTVSRVSGVRRSRRR
jgi:hypothetical protein